MVNYREILRLRSLGYSRRQISASAHCSTHTASFVVDKASELGIKWTLDASVSNAVLDEMFHTERRTASNPRKEPDYAYVHRELAKPGFNLSLLWTESTALPRLLRICMLWLTIGPMACQSRLAAAATTTALISSRKS